MRCACFASLLAVVTSAALLLSPCHGSNSYDHLPPMLFAVPRIQIAGDGDQGLRGIDVGFVAPMRGRSSVTARVLLDFEGDSEFGATYNRDWPLDVRTIGRASVGVIHSQPGLGVSAHRDYGDHGAGAFLGTVGGNLEAGVFVSTPLRWGTMVGRPSEGGARPMNVGDGGALATLGMRPREGERTEVATETAWFPHSRLRAPVASSGVAGALWELGPPLERAWSCRLVSASVGKPVVAGDSLYVGGRDGVVRVLRVSDGAPLWTAPIGAPISTEVTVAGGRIYVGTAAGQLVCLGPPGVAGGLLGVEHWRYTAGSPVRTAPVRTPHGRVIFGTDKGHLIALDARGRQVWSFQAAGAIVARVSVVTRPVNRSVHRSWPSPAQTLVYCAAGDGVVYALREHDGKKVWTVTTRGSFTAPPLAVDGRLIVCNEEGEVIALDGASGRQLWEQKVAGPIRAGAEAADGCVYVPSVAGVVSAFRLADGRAVWNTRLGGPLETPAVITGNGHLLLASQTGTLYALRRSDGQLTWAESIGEELAGAPSPGGGHLFVAGATGRLLAYARGGTWRIEEPLIAATPHTPATAQPSVPGGTHPPNESQPLAATPRAEVPVPPAPTQPKPPTQIPEPSATSSRPFPRPIVGGERPGSDDDGRAGEAEMSLLTTPGDPQQPPIQVVDRTTLTVHGPVPEGTVRVTVNDVPVPVSDGVFRTQIGFEGAGAYPLTIKFLGGHGLLEVQQRIVIVSPNDQPTSPAPIFVSAEAGSPGNRITFTIAAEGPEAQTPVNLLEIREENGRPLRAWADVGHGARSFEWDVRDQWGNPVPDGQYVAVYTLREENGRTRSIVQPLVIDSAGM